MDIKPIKKENKPFSISKNKTYFSFLFVRLNSPCNRCVHPTKGPACLREPRHQNTRLEVHCEDRVGLAEYLENIIVLLCLFEADRPLAVPFDSGFEPCFLVFCWRACWCFDIVVASLWMGDFDSWGLPVWRIYCFFCSLF